MGSIIKYLEWHYMYFAPKVGKFRPNYTVSFQNKLILSENISDGGGGILLAAVPLEK